MFESLLTLLFVSNSSLENILPAQNLANPVEKIMVHPTPIKKNNLPIPIIPKAFFSFDLKSGAEIAALNKDKKMPIASLTKLATALAALKIYDEDEILVVPKRASQAIGSKVFFQAGSRVSVRDLLRALLISSGNDAAITLAGSTEADEKIFIKKMNEVAKNLKLKNTNFVNTTGLDQADHFSTAHDLALLTTHFLQQPLLKEIVKKKYVEIYTLQGKMHKIVTRNQLLRDWEDIYGVKTGTTPQAGASFIALVKNKQGQEVVTIVLNSPARFLDTKVVIKWIFKNFKW